MRAAFTTRAMRMRLVTGAERTRAEAGDWVAAWSTAAVTAVSRPIGENDGMTDSRIKRTAFHGRVFDVVVEPVQLPDGRQREVDIVRHRPSVVLVVMPDAQSVVLVAQYRHAVGRRLWEVPAGSLESGETPDAAARRECEEETGYAAGAMQRLGAFFAAPGYCDEEMIFYLATGLSRPVQPASPDEDEDIEARTFTVAEARAMVQRGEIVDMKSALALTLVP